MNVGGFAPECCLNGFLNPSYRRPWTKFYFTFDNIFCLDSLLFVLLHVVSLWTRRENIRFSLPVCTNTNIALVSNEKTRSLLQKISKCDKEIQLIRIRCRHMRLQLRFFSFSSYFAYKRRGSDMKQKTIKTKSHAVQPEEIRLDWGSEILENSKLKTKSLQAHERRKKKVALLIEVAQKISRKSLRLDQMIVRK